MRNLIKYSLKQTLRDRETMFWGAFFPIILSLLFFFSFMRGGTPAEKMSPIQTAIVVEKNGKSDEEFQTFLETLDKEVISLQQLSEEEAIEALGEGNIKGYFIAGNERRLCVGGSGIEQSVLKALLDSYNQNEYLIMETIREKPQKVAELLEAIGKNEGYTKEVSFGGTTLVGDIQYFFALIGMACLYGSFLGMTKAVELQGNVSALGARRGVTPTNKMKLIVSDLLSVFTVHFLNVVLLLLFLKYILKLNFGENMNGMLLVCFMGSLIGVSIGIVIGSIKGISEQGKIACVIGISMISSFLSGLMVDNMKYVIERYVPIVNRINPASLIADAFYCLTVYEDMERYYRNLYTLTAISVLLIIISFFMVRRKRYDSI